VIPTIPNSTQPNVHKELIVNLQEEVNFLAKQNTRLKSAIMNGSGIGLIPTFQRLTHKGMENLRNQFISVSIGYQKRIDHYEHKISSVFQTMAQLRHKILVSKRNNDQFKQSSLGQI
jgi:hypothetical protein